MKWRTIKSELELHILLHGFLRYIPASFLLNSTVVSPFFSSAMAAVRLFCDPKYVSCFGVLLSLEKLSCTLEYVSLADANTISTQSMGSTIVKRWKIGL